MRSMTGFGSASAERDGVGYLVEVRSLNNRYYKSTIRLPEDLQALEAELESILRRRLNRGTVVLRVVRTEAGVSAAFTVDTDAIADYVNQIRSVPQLDGLTITLDAGTLLQLPGVLRSEIDEVERFEQARAIVSELADRACDGVIEMRGHEGRALAGELLEMLDTIDERLLKVAALAPDVIRAYEQRLKQRIEMLLDNADLRVTETDVIREIAVYAEKTDIAEEVQRLGAHLVQFRELLNPSNPKPVGRTLDFLAQEMLREANTIASKSPDAAISRETVEIKGAIDRIKEQVQNVE